MRQVKPELKQAEEERSRYRQGVKRLEATIQSERQKQFNLSSIKQRLLNRLRFRTVPVSFKDEFSEFEIEVRLLSPAEQRELFNIQRELSELGGKAAEADTQAKQKAVQEKLEALDDKACEFLGRICVDPELDKEFWKRGEGFSADVPAKIFREVMRLSSASEEQIRFLREAMRGKGSSSS